MCNREELVYLAKLSEQAERYDEMVDCMKKVVKENPELNVEERNLLSVAFKNVIGSRRASRRIVSSIEAKEAQKGADAHVKLIKEYRTKVDGELSKICEDVLTILDGTLIPAAPSGESKVFFYKMKGDYHRYAAEVDLNAQEQKNSALEAYTKATEVAAVTLPPTHPIRLGLALNFSVFYYEILRDPDRCAAGPTLMSHVWQWVRQRTSCVVIECVHHHWGPPNCRVASSRTVCLSQRLHHGQASLRRGSYRA
eukprot:TRINITY_DN66132_c6_g4_i2.p1 TRINITY_DN66132_c6_g4~~TRINITY_DN66132_c6_g4_i2.p1  ORF type:complete len:253 (+),score=29.81 TRINITY_DN66132_c6_g4_i2:79-837(+)